METENIKGTSKLKRKRSLKKSSKETTKKRKLNCRQYTIPKEKFRQAFEEINNDVEWNKIYLERNCSVPIQQISSSNRHNYRNVLYKLLEEARLCTLQRDWDGLAKILAMTRPVSKKEHILLFPIFVRYAVICLAQNPKKELLDMFMQGVVSCSGNLEKQQFLNSFTNN